MPERDTVAFDHVGVTLQPTGALRIRLRSTSDEKGVLQAEWVNMRTGDRKWQDVPTVFEP